MANTKILMCSPVHFGVNYEINPWMQNQQGRVNRVRANDQWARLYNEISRIADVLLIPEVEGLPDLVFTANAGVVHDNIAIVSRFRNVERRGEEFYFTNWFIKHGYLTINIDNYYEGAGDHLVDHLGRHWLGTGWRTDPLAAVELSRILDRSIRRLELVDNRWYHLDTCFCPLTGGELLWYPAAFSASSQRMIRAEFEHLISVSLEDALNFACNTVCIGRNIFIPNNKGISDRLRELGYTVYDFDLGEFMRAGGAAKCLTLIV